MSFKSEIGKKRIHFSQIDSTNSEAKRLLQSGDVMEGTIITADFQTQGRGQYGRQWQSSEYQNITMSVILHPIFIKIHDQFLLNIAFSTAISNVVSFYCEGVSVKWPNDIFIDNKKVAGILIENFIQSDILKSTIAGIGINVLQTSWEDVPGATSIALNTNEKISGDSILSQICEELNKAYIRLRLDANGLKGEYVERLYNKNILCSFQTGEGLISGIIKGVDEIGRLLVEQNDQIIAYAHNEIRIVIPE